MSKVWIAVLWIVVAMVFAGCETTPPAKPLLLTTVTVTNDFEIAAPAPLVAAPVAPVEPPPAPVVVTPSPVAQPTWPTNWINVWIPVESWGKYNRLEKYTYVRANPHPTVQFPTPQGAVALKVGTRVASLNGLDFWLGFAPQVIKGIPCVHWLDAKKGLQPLINPSLLPCRRTIVIDPGHGGVDSGTKSVYNGHYEKEYTLDWALRVAQLLEKSGWTVVLTRTSDKELSLTDRVSVADRAKADVFLSLHFNSGAPNRELAGVETYCLTPTGMPSSLLQRTYEDDVRQSYPNNAFDEQNLQLALRLHSSILQTAGTLDRGVRRARFMGVLRHQNRPAVLIEGGYLSNQNEARRVATPEYRQKLAEAVAAALKCEEG